jgi:hypothetical protein
VAGSLSIGLLETLGVTTDNTSADRAAVEKSAVIVVV